MSERPHPYIEQAHELGNFIEEIRRHKDEEEKKIRKTGHFTRIEFHPEELTFENMVTYKKLMKEIEMVNRGEQIPQEELMNPKEYNEYIKEATRQEVERIGKRGKSTQLEFLAYLNNLAAIVFGRRQQAEQRKKKEKHRE